jgi:hypothetical protein
MAGWQRTKRFLAAALAAALLVLLAATNVHAEMLHVGIHAETMTGKGIETGVKEIYAPLAARPAPKLAPNDEQRLVDGLKGRWETMREALLRTTLETMTTMIFGYWGPPPPPPMKSTIAPAPPPTGQGSTPPPPPPPPPPSGSGETPTTVDPPTDPSTPSTPEPTGFMLAFLGAGLTSFYGWRRRRKN